MKKLLCILLALLLPVIAIAQGSEDTAQIVLNAFLEGDYGKIEGMLGDTLRGALGADQLRAGWEMQLESLGAFVEVGGLQAQDGAAAVTLIHEKGAQLLQIALDEEGKLSGLLLQPVQPAPQSMEKALQEGCSEQDVLLFEGSERELKGKITLPSGEAKACVVLVHGSGPSDMDESIYANKPFRDLAYDLAALGVGSVRFDKITYAHPELPCPTVEQEYLEPVTEALRVLREHADGQKIFLLGHSQGGMLMPWLVQQCGFDGGIALAGTPRALWEISYQQNLDMIALMPAEMQAPYIAQIEQERIRGEALAELSDEEAMQTTIFGMNAYYLKHMAALDQIALAIESAKPMLFLWGEADVQVSRGHFEAWQESLGASGLYSYISYPGLNHLFMQAQEGESIANIAEAYSVAGSMDGRVAADIAAWLNG